jgi:hypothetical protein
VEVDVELACATNITGIATAKVTKRNNERTVQANIRTKTGTHSGVVKISNAILDALPDEPVLQSNSLATVTPTCVIVRTARGPSHNVISLASISDMRRVKTSYSGLLVISAALFLIAAAAYSSKQGANASIPMAIFALAFLIFYVGSRRASVVFNLDGETLETAQGSFREAAALIKAVRKAKSA